MHLLSLDGATLAANTLTFLDSLALGADFFWDNSLFAKDTWGGLMRGLRILLSMGGALLLIYAARARKMGEPVSPRLQRRVALFITVLGFGAYFEFFNPNVRYHEYYHRHEFYHYYLGSKYFNEVGYTRLYECTAVAEIELGRADSIRKREIRDLGAQNLIKPMTETYVFTEPERCKKHFTSDRWEAWKKDVNWFYESAKGGYWEGMQKDHGYNPPPLWTMVGKFFGSFGPASDGFFKLLSSIDVFLQAGALAMVGWAFGFRVMAIASVFWGVNGPANFYWTGGAFIRQDWIFFLVASVCLARKRRFMLAGGALMWSGLIRVFPLGLFAGYGLIILLQAVREWRARALGKSTRTGLLSLLHQDHRRLIAGAAIAAAVLVPSSMLVAGGVRTYPDFWKHITLHTHTPLTNHMGLKTMLTHTWDGRMRFTKNEGLDDPFAEWKQGRLDRAKESKPLRLAIVLGLGLWMAWALRRTKLLWVGIPMGLTLLMSLTDITCYYFSCFLTAAVLTKQRPSLGPPFLVASGVSLLFLNVDSGFYFVDDRYTAESYLFFLVGCLVLYAYSRPFSLARLMAWWNYKPEPKDKSVPPKPSPSTTPAESTT